ncbi:amidohydrolase family protein [Amycolatopsis jejuensis]|uniref:amidohydrolase family protein n=1 Tax=Amycolatopsis jejuensis TaxID=330084 RepID=UPI000ABB915C|nr:amidohydrolase family protein [Amycolatopsis jejuensis]
MPSNTLIRGGHVLTMDPELGDLPVGDVLVTDGRIAAVGTEIVADAEVIDASGAIVLPGLIDGHRHVWQSLLRGVASDWSLPEYLREARSMYCACFDPDDAYLANYLGGLESINAGITTVVDHSHLQRTPEITDALVRGLLDSRVGGVFCYGLQNVPGMTDPGAVRDLLTRLPDDWHDANAQTVRDKYFADPRQRLRFGIALPESAPYLPADVLDALVARATALNPSLITGHWNDRCPDVFPSHPQISLTHANHLSDDDLTALAEAGIGLCTTPDIECGMGTGPLLARRFASRGGAASLGTDITSYTRADILAQARLLLQVERSADALPPTVTWRARDALDLATRSAATSLGLASEVGTLTTGTRGDVVVVRPDPLGATPVGDPAATLLFYTSPAEVETVVVEGELVKRDGALVGVDIADVRQLAEEAAERIRARYDRLPRAALEGVWSGLFG